MPPKLEAPSKRLKHVKVSASAPPSESVEKLHDAHTTPAQLEAKKTKRVKSSLSNKKKAAQKEAAMERAQKLEKRRDEVESKKDKKKKARQMWQ
ncbi:hypothetical protein JCM10213_002670 [Rhodosporidiobolus nylandii]